MLTRFDRVGAIRTCDETTENTGPMSEDTEPAGFESLVRRKKSRVESVDRSNDRKCQLTSGVKRDGEGREEEKRIHGVCGPNL